MKTHQTKHKASASATYSPENKNKKIQHNKAPYTKKKPLTTSMISNAESRK
jgi:hypothetical protein